MTTTLFSFREADKYYRHAMDFGTDEVFFQELNRQAERPEDEWKTLLRYDPNCGAWTADGKKIGYFRVEGEHWVFYDSASEAIERIEGPNFKHAEGLLEFEVAISKRWLAQQQPTKEKTP